MEGLSVVECAPHEELVCATAKEFGVSEYVARAWRSGFIAFKQDKDE